MRKKRMRRAAVNAAAQSSKAVGYGAFSAKPSLSKPGSNRVYCFFCRFPAFDISTENRYIKLQL